MANGESFVNELTGEAMTSQEFVVSLRSLERQIQRLDDQLVGAKLEVKTLKQARDRAVAELRSAVRENKTLAARAARDARRQAKQPKGK